ncbi:aldo/keto reductase, partial [Amycolatopsis sp. NPDC004079]
STSGPAQADVVRRAFELESGGQPVFSSVQSTWNVFEPSVGPALAEAKAAGKRVLVKETLANGRLVSEAPEPLRRIAGAHGVGPDAIAVAAVLGQEWAPVAVIGPSSTAQLTANLAATQVRLSDDERSVLGGLAQDSREYWAHRSHLGWS